MATSVEHRSDRPGAHADDAHHTDHADHTRHADLDEQSVGELVSQASEQISRLVRDEMRLAQAEMAEKGRRAGTSAGLLGGAGIVGFLAAQAFMVAAIAALSLVLSVWSAALVVATVLLAVAAVLALTGKEQASQAVPPKPEEAMDNVRADLDEIRERARS